MMILNWWFYSDDFKPNYLITYKNSNTAVVLIAVVTISGTPCPRHTIVPFSAESPSDHVTQAWATPPPSWYPNPPTFWLITLDKLLTRFGVPVHQAVKLVPAS